jgi:enterochelin esterase-like enzyme
MYGDWVMRRSALVFGLVILAAATAGAQGRRGAPPPANATPRAGKTERVTIRDRDVLVYLPPSYESDAARRFPAVYLVTERPIETLGVPQAVDRLAAAQGFSEPVVILTDADPADLVGYVDEHYRTIAARISRGLGGYAAGGEIALRAAMKRPDVFSSLYLLNASVADASIKMLDESAASLVRLYSVAINIGTKEPALASNRQLHASMTRVGIPHYYEEYDGGRAEVSERVESRLVPFFSRILTAPANPTSPAVQ